MKQKYFWPRLAGTAFLLHLVLILLSVLEVGIYSYLLNPGHDREFYEAHARQSAPWISYVFGSLFCFLLVKRFVKRYTRQQLMYAIALPLLYSAIDAMLLIASAGITALAGTEFIVGKFVKILAGLIAYFAYAGKNENSGPLPNANKPIL